MCIVVTMGERIKELMEKYGYSQKELAGLAGVTESAMTRYLQNERVPRADVIANFATALNTTTDFLISGKSEKDSIEDIQRLVARNSKKMSSKEKMELIKLIMG